MEIGLLVPASDIVAFAGLARQEHGPKGRAVVADVEPVAHVHAITINGDGAALDHTLDDDGDEFFRMLAWAVVVRAAGDDGRQAVGVVIATHEHVARGFAGGIGRVGRVRRGFGEGGVMRAEGAEDFIGADMQEAVPCLHFPVRGLPVGMAGFEEMEGAVDVGGDEVARTGDAAIHVRLCCEMHDVGDVMLADDAEDFGLVAEIDLLKNVTRVDAVNAIEIFEMTGVSEAVEIDERGDLRPVNEVPDEIGADEACAACDEKVHPALTAAYSLKMPMRGMRRACWKPAA